ncbi:MAG: UDP-glucose 4-epimerase GalE [Fimbriimonas sp.]|nr:UDP-glucose 4-epimerase GalE [Fimbriimonas sp.]
MRILVTGGAGFIGSVIAASLIEAGHEVVVLDDLRYGHCAAVPAGAGFVKASVEDASAVMAAFRETSFDAVVHLAGEASVGESALDPGRFYTVNLQGGINVLEGMRCTGVERIIFSSTASIFGEPDRIPITETNSQKPINAYGETKLAFEKALKWYRRSFGIRHVSFRYFNACGATATHGEDRVKETHLIPILLQVVLGIRPEITLFGTDYPTPDRTCVRDYVHVADIAQAHLLGLDRIDELEEAAYNLGSGTGNSNLEVIETARKVTGHPIPVKIGDRRPGDPAVLVAGSDLAREVLGWDPQYAHIEQMVQSAWDWRSNFPDGYPK